MRALVPGAAMAVVLLAGSFASGAASGLGPGPGSWESRSPGEFSPSVYELTARVTGAEGQPVDMRIEVSAQSLDEAHTAARGFASALSPAPDGVSAAWLPWMWKWDDAELPVDVAYNPEGAPLTVGPSAIIAGLQAWSNAEGSAFRYRYAGITNNTASILEMGPDGENVISWNLLPCERGCVLAVTSKLEGHEVDMVLNSNPAAAEQLGVGTKLDWRTVILHELGHMAGLDHSCPVPFGPCTPAEADAVMFFQYRGILRKLALDDVAGIAALYPVTPAGTPIPGASPTPAPTATAAPELVVVLEAGWNLVVLPAGAIGTVAGALPCLSAVYSYEGGEWRAWIRGAPDSLQGVSAIEAGRGYWALGSGSCARTFP